MRNARVYRSVCVSVQYHWFGFLGDSYSTVLVGRTVGVLRTGVHVLLLVGTRIQCEPFLYSSTVVPLYATIGAIGDSVEIITVGSTCNSPTTTYNESQSIDVTFCAKDEVVHSLYSMSIKTTLLRGSSRRL